MYMREQEFCRCYSCDGVPYRVRQGDTLYSISRRFEVALEDVMDANPFVNVYRLEPGMRICVPVPETEGGTWEEDRKSRENGRKIRKESSFDDRGKTDDGSVFDGRRKLESGGSAESCPYGLCRDPMRFDGMGW
ncbi:MAG: LysM domain-containing protein [Lachnospiraceae bacterium]|nr:LysM domain-containing protein [Lachnospiraceae bacterium]